MSRRALLALACAAVCACGGGGGRAGGEVRSALLLTLDTTRRDALGCYGGPPQASPRLDALAAQSVIYEEARTVSPLTMPAHASMLTGLVPLRHTVHANSRLALPRSAVTVAERARERGFQTAAFVAAVVLADDFGLDQGFTRYDQPTPPLLQETLHYDRRPGDEVADATIRWLRALDRDRPFFAWAHFFDAHLPYAPPPEIVAQVGHDGYHAGVATMDRAIGRILDALEELDLADETLIVVVGDHGEALGEHGEDTHGTLAYDGTMRVPFLVRDPGGARAGERSREQVSVTDVYPTLVEALGLGAPGDVDGLSLHRRTVPEDRGVYLETYYGYLSFNWSPIVGWADRGGKYLCSSEPELYRVAQDPGETRNVIAEASPEELARYRAGIAALARKPALARAEEDAADAGAVGALEGLGYAGGGAGDPEAELPDPLAPPALPSPAAMRATYRAFALAQEITARDPARAVELYRGVVAADPRNPSAWFQLGGALILVGELEEAVRASQRALELGPDWYGPHKNVAVAQHRLGRAEEALAAYEAALATAPLMLDALQSAIDLCESLGRSKEADAYRLRLLEAREAAARRR